jgi:hypothetical protein
MTDLQAKYQKLAAEYAKVIIKEKLGCSLHWWAVSVYISTAQTERSFFRKYCLAFS